MRLLVVFFLSFRKMGLWRLSSVSCVFLIMVVCRFWLIIVVVDVLMKKVLYVCVGFGVKFLSGFCMWNDGLVCEFDFVVYFFYVW